MEFQKVMSINQWLATLDKSYVDPTIALKLSGLTVKNEMINHIKKVQQQIAQQAQEQQQAEQQQKQKADKEREEQMAMAKNHQKIQLLTALNGLHKSTLENRGLSDQISSNNIVKQLFGGSKAA
jgi:FKBP-type peptidyl-prolyl cis-trans isomerase